MNKRNKLLTIKPSEALELVIHRLRDNMRHISPEHHMPLQLEIVDELEALHDFLKETGQ